MSDQLPPSEEVLTEEFYDVCAFLRDLDLSKAPPFFRVSWVYKMPLPTTIVNENDELVEVVADWLVEIQRFNDGGPLHLHAPGGMCSDIDPVKLEEKRPS